MNVENNSESAGNSAVIQARARDINFYINVENNINDTYRKYK